MASSDGNRNAQSQVPFPSGRHLEGDPRFRIPQVPPQRIPRASIRRLSLSDDDSSDLEDSFTNASSAHEIAPSHQESDIDRRIRRISNRVAISGPHFQQQIESTPVHPSISRPSERGQLAKVQGLMLMKTIGHTPTASTDYMENMGFASSLTANQIKTWLTSKENKLYGAHCMKSWTKEGKAGYRTAWCLPEVATQEKDLYPDFMKIISGIIERFVKPGLGKELEREVMKTDNVPLTHKDMKTYTSPDMAIRATGPSFETPPDKKAIGYSNIIAFFDAKREEKIGGAENRKQMAVYSQQIFAFQPNRIFVRGILLSEKTAQMIQFDRAGAQLTPFINIHKSPEEFVRMIVEVCETNERKIGFDDTIRWDIVDGKKAGGTITYGDGLNKKVYNLANPQPITHSSDIRGEATTLWEVQEEGPQGKSFLIKDSWGTVGRTPEHELLLKTVDIKGVCKMIDYYFRDFTAATFRCSSTLHDFVDQQPVRILIETCGHAIEKFGSVSAALYAIHDAIVAHYQLYSAYILHRDITNQSILVGQPDAKEGWRGVLLNLGSALNFDPDNGDSAISKEARLGTRFFQSCMILNFLSGFNDGHAPPHDHMDDIESFFNVCSYLFFCFNPDGTPRKRKDRAREVVKGWDSGSAREALVFKAMLFNPLLGQRQTAIDIVFKDWGVACGTLFKSFLDLISDIQQRKADIIQKHRRNQKKRGKEEDEGENEDEDEEDTAVDGGNKQGSKPAKDFQELDSDNPFLNELSGSDLSDESDGESEISDDEHPDDPIFSDEVERVFEPIDRQPKGMVSMEQGLFASLMDEATTNYHYKTVIAMFTLATTALQMSPQANGPPAADEGPKRKGAKRKVGQGPDEMMVDPSEQKVKSSRV